MSQKAAQSTHIPLGRYFGDIYLKPCTLNTQSFVEIELDTMSQNAAHTTHILFEKYLKIYI